MNSSDGVDGDEPEADWTKPTRTDHPGNADDNRWMARFHEQAVDCCFRSWKHYLLHEDDKDQPSNEPTTTEST